MAIHVEFRVSGITAQWDESFASILDLAEANGVKIDTDCEAGICGTCKVRMLSGNVDMDVEDGLENEDIEQNMILPCVAVPLTDVVLEI
jgi:glycine betaine catabolism B